MEMQLVSKTFHRAVSSEKMNSERLQGILTELACRSADIPVNMLPIPFDEELILDFGEEPVKDLKSKKEILKFEKSWIEMVEEEEKQQENLIKVESELKLMDPQINFKQEMQEELKKVAPQKVVRLRSRFLETENARKMWQPVHEELMRVLAKRNLEKTKIQRQKEIMLKELKVVGSRAAEHRMTTRERAEIMRRCIHKELMTVLTKRNLEEKQIRRQTKIMSEILKELKVVTSRDVERRKEMKARAETMRKSIHKELMTVWTMRIQLQRQKAMMSDICKELMVHVTVDTRTKMFKEGKLGENIEPALKDVVKTIKPDTAMPEEEQDLFVPRKLFLFNVETFKNFQQNIETATLHEKSEIMDNKCTSRVDMVPSLPKKKSFGRKLRKIFGFK